MKNAVFLNIFWAIQIFLNMVILFGLLAYSRPDYQSIREVVSEAEDRIIQRQGVEIRKTIQEVFAGV